MRIAIRTDNTNRFVFVPHLGTDQVFQFLFDEKSGRLTANTPPVVQLKQGTGPRHLIVSADNRFVYLLNELTATVTTLSLDANTGTLKELDSVSALPAGHQARPGMPRGAVGAPGEPGPAEHRQRHLGFGSSPYAERPLPLCRRAHVEHARRLPRRRRERKLTFSEARQPRSSPAASTSTRPAASVVSGEKSERSFVYAIDAETGALKPIGRYPTGKGANWVEIVALD